LLGRDAAAVLSEDTRRRAREILESDREMEERRDQMIVLSTGSDPARDPQCELLIKKLGQGFLKAPVAESDGRHAQPEATFPAGEPLPIDRARVIPSSSGVKDFCQFGSQNRG
jgi:hypothetical protein